MERFRMSVNQTLSPSAIFDEYELNERQRATCARIVEQCNITATQVLEGLVNRMPTIKRGHEALRSSLADAYRLYGMVRNNDKVKEAVVRALEQAGKWKNSRQKLLNAMLSQLLDLDRRRASTYAQVILAALNAEVDFVDFENFLAEGRGIDSIARKRSKTNTKSLPAAPEFVTASGTLPPDPSLQSEYPIFFAGWPEEVRDFCEKYTGPPSRNNLNPDAYLVRVVHYPFGGFSIQIIQPDMGGNLLYYP